MTERQIAVHRTIPASATDIWEVLADFPNIAAWNSGVKASHAIGEATRGVGARRHCDLTPVGGLDETVLEWDEGTRMVISIDKATKVPLKSAELTFELVPESDDVTGTTIEYQYRPNGGRIIGAVFGRLFDRRLTSGFTEFLVEVEAAARTRIEPRPMDAPGDTSTN